MAEDNDTKQTKEAAMELAQEEKARAQDSAYQRAAPPGRTAVHRPHPGPAGPGAPPQQVESRETPHGFGQSGAAPPQLENAQPSKGRYRLLTPHMIGGHYLDAGTEVGEGTSYPMAEPSNQMAGVDDAGKEAVNKLHQRLYGQDAMWHDENHPVAQMQRNAADAQKQREEDHEAEPVSAQQAWERGHDTYRDEKLSGPPGGALVSRTISGDTSQPMGPATARQDPMDPDVQVRTTQPLKDQMPQEGAGGGGTQQPHKR